MKSRYFRSLLIVFFLTFLSLGLSVNGFSQTRHKEATVTRAPWQEKYQRIELDGIKYTFMPDAVLYERENNRNGGYSESPTSYYKIYNGRKVSVQVQGHRIYQLVILP